jgi:hypothetical protein
MYVCMYMHMHMHVHTHTHTLGGPRTRCGLRASAPGCQTATRFSWSTLITLYYIHFTTYTLLLSNGTLERAALLFCVVPGLLLGPAFRA